jgi:surfactin synthase thioesterase subunit
MKSKLSRDKNGLHRDKNTDKIFIKVKTPDKYLRCIRRSVVTVAEANAERSKPRWRKWLQRSFIIWAVVSTGLLANSFRTRGVEPSLLQNNASVTVVDVEESLQFLPASPEQSGLIFVCGGGVAAHAYAPLLRPIADAGYSVFIIKLPFRLAPLESHKLGAIDRVYHVMAEHPEISRWVLSGHSLGAALACRVARDDPEALSALVLVGTTHPKNDNLASLKFPVTKVYGANDGVAPREKIQANKHLLPKHTRWVLIDGANHSQFAHYGHQLLDGTATISRKNQQDRTRTALLESLDDLTD